MSLSILLAVCSSLCMCVFGSVRSCRQLCQAVPLSVSIRFCLSWKQVCLSLCLLVCLRQSSIHRRVFFLVCSFYHYARKQSGQSTAQFFCISVSLSGFHKYNLNCGRVCLSVGLFVCLFDRSVHRSLHLSVCLTLYRFLFTSLIVPICSSFFLLSIHTSLCMLFLHSVRLFDQLFINLSVNPFIFVSPSFSLSDLNYFSVSVCPSLSFTSFRSTLCLSVSL